MSVLSCHIHIDEMWLQFRCVAYKNLQFVHANTNKHYTVGYKRSPLQFVDYRESQINAQHNINIGKPRTPDSATR